MMTNQTIRDAIDALARMYASDGQSWPQAERDAGDAVEAVRQDLEERGASEDTIEATLDGIYMQARSGQ